MLRALVRPPGESLARAISAQVPRPIIDIVLARKQHAEYCAALRAAGVELVELPTEETFPDSCFVQDTAVVWGELAVIARFGVESRQGEQDKVRPVLQGHKRLIETQPPATLEGGDVLILGSRVFVGLSARTNRAGYAQLRDHLELAGATVEPLPVVDSLHLLSDCTYLGQSVLLATGAVADLPIFSTLDVIRVPAPEAYAANALGLGTYVILPDGNPLTAAQIRDRGFQVLEVSLSEFAKADGGVTCLSLLY